MNSFQNSPRQVTSAEHAELARYGFSLREGITDEQAIGFLATKRRLASHYGNEDTILTIDKLIAGFERKAAPEPVLTTAEASDLRLWGLAVDEATTVQSALDQTRRIYNEYLASTAYPHYGTWAANLEGIISRLEARVAPARVEFADVAPADATAENLLRQARDRVDEAFRAGADEVNLIAGDTLIGTIYKDGRFTKVERSNPWLDEKVGPPDNDGVPSVKARRGRQQPTLSPSYTDPAYDLSQNPHASASAFAKPAALTFEEVIGLVEALISVEQVDYSGSLSSLLDNARVFRDATNTTSWFLGARSNGVIQHREAEFIRHKNHAAEVSVWLLLSVVQHALVSGVHKEDLLRHIRQEADNGRGKLAAVANTAATFEDVFGDTDADDYFGG